MKPAADLTRRDDATAAQHDAAFMSLALEAARRAGLAGQPPVGACVVRDGRAIATRANSVIADLDVTAHAEIAAIRAACHAEGTISLANCEMYTTVEPCPMCLAACHYAGIRRVVYGASLDDMQAITGRELINVTDDMAWARGIQRAGGCLRAESLALLQQWAAATRR
jgi:tRNA(Arg) A34 adenosine deaminase TadA